MDNVDEVRDAVVSRRAMFGTVDSWLIWVSQRGLGTFSSPWQPLTFFFPPRQCLTGGKSGGVHCTDATNASRTMLFNIHTLDWDPELCKYGVPSNDQ